MLSSEMQRGASKNLPPLHIASVGVRCGAYWASREGFCATLSVDGTCHRNRGSMGDKSPKSKHRDKSQKAASDAKVAAKAKAKQEKQAAPALAAAKKK